MHTDQTTVAAPVQQTGRSNKLLKDIFCEETSAEYHQALEKARTAVEDFLHHTKQPFTGVRPADMREAVYSVDLTSPLTSYDDLLAEVNELYIRHATAFHLPQYIAHLNCPVVIPALAAEVIISAINSSQDTYDQSAGGTFMERRLIDWTAHEIGYTNADGVFTGGGSQSNLMGLLLARDHFARQVLCHNIKLDGLPSQAGRFRIFVSDKAHFSNDKNASLLGLGEQAIVRVKTDSRFRMDAEALKEALDWQLGLGNIPIAVVATAGTTDFGNIDPLQAIAAIATEYQVWMHVDAAYGCGLLLSGKYRHLLNGIEQADSVTIDYHKSFFQPISSSAFLVKDKATLQLVRHHADYLNPAEQDDEELPAQINKSITQSTRRFDALKLWCTLRLMGKQKLGIYTDMIIDTAAATAALLQQDPEFDLLSSSDLGVLVFRFRPMGLNTDLSALNLRIKQSLFFDGTYILASTRVAGNFYLKFTILNPLTTLAHIREILAAIKAKGYSLL
ncbi:pyridoxal phosphate-dependent decarboxylase family protein [Chitinophaga varians]|uniref:pyridoxal phosphate-dependent decarboxylase family protein n=1 Tax=Chitinophaga varians TaxID=2202339 RepID=UPI00165FED1A|nr:aspartate aminotransferase family protein [Chitinophaga varians]MBC9914645.1 aspartate aminotransferase family protein [Chitinophaga varians]